MEVSFCILWEKKSIEVNVSLLSMRAIGSSQERTRKFQVVIDNIWMKMWSKSVQKINLEQTDQKIKTAEFSLVDLKHSRLLVSPTYQGGSGKQSSNWKNCLCTPTTRGVRCRHSERFHWFQPLYISC